MWPQPGIFHTGSGLWRLFQDRVFFMSRLHRAGPSLGRRQLYCALIDSRAGSLIALVPRGTSFIRWETLSLNHKRILRWRVIASENFNVTPRKRKEKKKEENWQPGLLGCGLGLTIKFFYTRNTLSLLEALNLWRIIFTLTAHLKCFELGSEAS